MRNNLVVIVVAAVIVSYLLISPFAGDRAVGQPQAVPASAAGRYQMVVGKAPFGQNKETMDAIYVLDTQTGQVWRQVTGGKYWDDRGSPIRKDKKK
jgi:hypothetical protein